MDELPPPRFLPAGEAALCVEFGSDIDPLLNARVSALDAALVAYPIAGIVETVPTYRSLLIHFDPQLLSTADLIVAIQNLAAAPVSAQPHGRAGLSPHAMTLRMPKTFQRLEKRSVCQERK